MKFYYNGVLVRTSKNHVYTHAIIDKADGRIVGCRATKEAAEREIGSAIAEENASIEGSKEKIKAMQAGKRMYRAKVGRRWEYLLIDSDETVDGVQKWIEIYEKRIEYIRRNWIVVELEAKA